MYIIYEYTYIDMSSDCVSWISAFGVVTSLLIISWSIFIATCVVAVCHLRRKDSQSTKGIYKCESIYSFPRIRT